MGKSKKLTKFIYILGVLAFLLGFFLVLGLIFNADNYDVFLYSYYNYIFIGLIVLVFVIFIIVYNLGKKKKPETDFFFENQTRRSIENLNKEKARLKKRFSELLRIDEYYKNNALIEYDKVDSLSVFCENFRNFCATMDEDKPLYYDKKDIRSFISNLAVSHIMILQGMSGTGKTSIAVAFQKFIENQIEVIAIQPMWKERSDLLGYYNEFTKKFNETQLLKELYESTYNDKMFIVILDEMNIARVEYYFAEFLSLLELEVGKRNLEVTSDHWPSDPKKLIEGKLHILNNVYFLGTANNDESTFSISDKVYDRSMILNLDKRAVAFNGVKKEKTRISNSNFIELVENAKKDFDNENMEIVSSWIEKINILLNKYFEINFGNRMVQQLKYYIPVYVACGGSKEEAFDDFVAKKIFRKFESKDPIKIKLKINEFIDELNEEFSDIELKSCLEYLKKYLKVGYRDE